MSAQPVRAPVEVNFKANGVPEVQKGMKVISGEANTLGLNSRRAGNSMNILAASAAAGTGSLAGMAVAMGNVAEGIAAVSKSAAIAASAVGIGVLIGALGVLVGLVVEAKHKLEEMPDGKLAASAAGRLKDLHETKQVQAEIDAIDKRRAAETAKLTGSAGVIGAGGNSVTRYLKRTIGYTTEDDKKRAQLIVDLDKQREAALVRQREIVGETRDRTLKGIQVVAESQTSHLATYRATLANIEAERLEAIRTHELTETAADARAAKKRLDARRAYQEFVSSEVLRGIRLNQSNAFSDSDAAGAKKNAETARITTLVSDSVALLQTNITRTFDQAEADIKERTERIRAMASEVAGVFSSGLEAGFSGGGFEGAGRAVLAGLGGILKEIGEKALIGMELVQTIAANLSNPVVGIPAAIALIALGSFMQSLGSSGGSGSGGGGSVSGGSYASGGSDVMRFPVMSSMPANTPAAKPSMSFTVIGDGPKIQREIATIVNGANSRGLIK